ncbi:MAG: hypothetical protein Q7S07_01640 [Candidatus Omnitrophota bacterium]|nr:hypothetical protein [Candidatus Omnitrophota bacterium]
MSEADKEAVKWYHRPAWVVAAILAAGPFALPLVWSSPKLGRRMKIFLTIAVIIITVWLVRVTLDIYRVFMKEMADLQSIVR